MSHHEIPLIGQLPRGLTDLFFEQAAAKNELETVLQTTFRQWGYGRIIPPTFEYYETLATEASPQLEEEMYRFFDREGHVLALRPDMTVATARLVGTKLYDQMLPLRFYYVGNVFRYEEPQAGRRREFTQAGIELIGAGTLEADAEVLAVAIDALQAINISQFQINLGQVAFLKAILSDGRLSDGDLRRLEKAIERKNGVELQRALAELGVADRAARAVRAIPHLCGDQDILGEARRLATNGPARLAIEHLGKVYDLLCGRGVARHIVLDLSEVRGMGYYTGITFHGYVAGLGSYICGGGRYDGLIAHFGHDLPAVGFALGVERSMLVAQPKIDLAPNIVMQACQHERCRSLVSMARSRGFCVEVDVLGRRGEALIEYARARGAHHAIFCREASTYVVSDAHGSREMGPHELEEEIASWNC